MTYKQSISNRMISIFLSIVIILTMIPLFTMSAFADDVSNSRVADPSTMDSWRDFFGTPEEFSTNNAGGVWMDKSVLTDASAFAGTGISQDDPDSFLVALSVMAANMSVTGMSHTPTDSILVLDVSGSMNNDSGNNDVAEELVQAANNSIKALLKTNENNRVGVVLYSGSSGSTNNYTSAAVVLLPLGRYTTGADGKYLNYTLRNSSEIISLDSELKIEGTNTTPTAASKEVVGATYMQRGIITAMNQFLSDDNSVTVNGQKRKPVMVIMSDGDPSLGSTNFTDPGYNQYRGYNVGTGSESSAALGFVTQLSAAYAKAKIEEKYGTDALFYTLGIGLSSSDKIALSVMDPDNADASTAVDGFWNDINTNWRGQVTFKGYNHISVGERVSLGNNLYVTKIETPLEQNYVDRYFEASGSDGNLADDLAKAFEEIVGAIQLQSIYYPTLISDSEELSGYVSFVDKIGHYMSVTDIKGILINNQLFSGADLASNFVTGGGNLGTYTEPTELGIEMVAAVRARLGLESDEVATTLIALAYEYGQLRYTDANDYSNYIGWYANAAGKFLGFYNEGTTVLPAATGDIETDPVFIIRSYGYLGVVDAKYGVSESDMMYATVQVRKDISTNNELVTFAVPAALIPTLTYNVTLDENENLTDLQMTGAQNPIRLVYEVALDDEISPFNIKESLSAEYLNDPHNVNEDGTINFYTNQWNHYNTTGYGTVNTYSYFNPSRQNDRYYYLEDTLVYTDTKGSLYNGTELPSANGVFYRSYRIYKNNNGNLSAEIVYREISDAVKETAVRNNDGTWYIPRGNVHVNLDGYTINKSENLTDTLVESSIPFVDTHNHSINDAGYYFYVGATLGNNGKLTVIPETGIRLSKSMAYGVVAPDIPFAFILTNTTDTMDNDIYPAWIIRESGIKTKTTVAFVDGAATVRLGAGDVIYIGGMTDGEVFHIAEVESVEYAADATGLSESGTVTIRDNEIIPVSFINDERGVGNLTIAKEVEHDYGTEYQIPEDKLFTMQVTLNGIGASNATFAAGHTNGSYTEITTDENGQFTVQLAHGQQFEVFGLPAGTTAEVVETEYGNGFTPVYWDNGVDGDGRVTILKDTTVSVVVVNDYVADKVGFVNLSLGGEKIVRDADGAIVPVNNWLDTYAFDIVLERYDEENGWIEIGRRTVDKNNPTFSFNDIMQAEKYEKSGVYSYQMYELEPAIDDASRVDGMIYDMNWHTFSVYVSDKDMDGMLEIVRVHSEHADKDFGLVGGLYTIEIDFENTQTTTVPALATVDIQKKLINNSDSPLVTLAGYKFGLYTDADCLIPATVGDGINAIVVNPTDAVGEGWIDIQLDMSGNYTFYVKEIAGSINKMAYSEKVIKVVVSVEVSENNVNALVASVEYYNEDGSIYDLNADGEVEFTNVYEPTNTELAIDFVSKEITGRELNNNEFTFAVQDVDGGTILEGTNNAEGEVIFNGVLYFDAVGTYVYNILETSVDGNGVTVDKTNYHIIVTVVDDNGALKATYTLVDAVGDTVTFRNVYRPDPVDYFVEGTKTLRGRTLINDEFMFVLTELTFDGVEVQGQRYWAAKNFGSGQIIFPTITYYRAGTYVYSAEELVPEGGRAYGIAYDTTHYKVTIVVKDDKNGSLYVESESVSLMNDTAANALSFVNEYDAESTWTQFVGNKQFIGKVNGDLQGGEFEFELYNADRTWERGSLEETVENGENGVITFTKIDFNTDEDRYFIIVEKNGGQVIDGITYDDTVYHIWVEIVDDLKGQLQATVHIYDDEGVPHDRISFVNAFNRSADDISVDINITKTVVNKGTETIGPKDFEFALSNPMDGTVTDTVITDEYGRARFSLNFTKDDIGNTYSYKITEVDGGIEGVTYSTAEHVVSIEVGFDEENNVLTATLTKDETVVTELSVEFENIYDVSITDIPQTGDNSNVLLWVALMFISGGALLSLAICDRKKKQKTQQA